MPTEVELSGNPDIDGILWGYRWTNTNLTYSFPTGTAEYTDNGYDAVNGFQAFTAAQQTDAVRILANYDNVCNVNFTQAAGGSIASLRFSEATSVDDGMNGLDVKSTATGTPPDPYEYPAYSYGDMWFNPTNYDQTPDPGTYTYTAGIMHEIGHALGLKHGHTDTQDLEHDDHVHNNQPALPADHDSQEYSIMTYRGYPGADPTEGTAEYSQTIMQNDIAALQYMYGANYDYNWTATTYTWSSTSGEMFINGVAQGLATGDHILMTVWDGGGNDTYDFSNYTTDLEVNLNPGAWTTVSDAQLANLGPAATPHLARGNIANALLYQGNTASLIENAIGGTGDDTMYGNQVSNTLTGNGGADTLKGGGGGDTLHGGSGDDTLWGGDGVDTLNGGNNNDSLKGGGGADNLNGGFGNDTAHYNDSNAGVTVVLSTSETTTASGGTAQGDDLNSIENINGSEYADTLFGSSVANVLNGNAGVDYLKGGGGADTLDGGTGNDTASYYGSSAGVTVGVAGTGTGGDAEGDILTDFENLIGSDHADTLMGDTGVNSLSGLAGDDTLKGGGGADALDGGTDNDTLKGGGGADTLDGGTGSDTAVYGDSTAGVTVFLSSGQGFTGSADGDTLANIENVTGSSHADWIVGDGNANTINGGSDSDIVKGGGGADTLIGAQGDDSLVGGLANDRFQFTSTNGTDTIYDFSQAENDRFVLDRAGLGLAGTGSLQSAGVDFVQGLNARTASATVLASGSDIYFDADGTGTQAAVRLAHVGDAMWTVGATGDFDGSGTTDLLWQNNATGETIQWLMATTGGAGYQAALFNTAGYTLVASGDFDANGTDDLLWQNNATGDTIEWLMATTGGVGYQASLGSTAGYSMVGSGDFDANGTDDFLWKNTASGDTVEWLTSTTGGIGYQAAMGSTTGWDVVASGDFDANGTTDFLWEEAATGNTIEWLMATTGGVGYQAALQNLSGWNLAASGDFDANGTTDFLWKEAATGNMVEWLTSPAGGIGYQAALSNTAGYDLVANGDFDANGTDDFMWKNVASGETIEWLSSPAGGIGFQAALPSTNGYSAVASGDFNGDGASDVLWQDATTGQTIEWLMSGSGGIGIEAALLNTAGWSVLSTGDFNGDATTDILWERAADGATAEWMMASAGGILADASLSGTGGVGVMHLTQEDFLVV